MARRREICVGEESRGPHLSVLSIGIAVTASLMLTAVSWSQVLVWSDEFNDSTLDLNNWEVMVGDGRNYGLPAGWGNNELQYYTSRDDNIAIGGGVLRIVARSERFNGADYTSARLRTRNRQEFLYGRIEARIKLPSGQGIWPAFWMLPTNSPYGGWAAGGEIDVMESVNAADRVYGTIHFGDEWPGNMLNGGDLVDGTDFSQSFHVFAIEWRPTEIRWFVDGAQYHVLQNTQWWSEPALTNPNAPFDSPFHLLLNVAVGGNFPGNPNGSEGFPMEMVVDWVRVYELAPQAPFGNEPHSIPGRVEGEEFDLGGAGVAYVDADAANNGGALRLGEGVDIQAAAPAGFNIGWLRQGEWIEYTVNVLATGTYRTTARVASAGPGGEFQLEFDGFNASGPIAVPGTGGWQSWTNVMDEFALPAGQFVMRFAFLGTDQEAFNVDWFDFELISCVGDANSDQIVDFADVTSVLSNWLANYGSGTGPGDANNDGVVNFGDITAVLGQWLAVCP